MKGSQKLRVEILISNVCNNVIIRLFGCFSVITKAIRHMILYYMMYFQGGALGGGFNSHLINAIFIS